VRISADSADRGASTPGGDRFRLAEFKDRNGSFAEPVALRVAVLSRREGRLAHRTWPNTFTSNIDGVFDRLERQNHQLAADGVDEIVMVPITVAGLIDHAARTGADPTKSDTRTAYVHELADGGGGIAWPPGRKELCWCQSGVKYKKCCGRRTSD